MTRNATTSKNPFESGTVTARTLKPTHRKTRKISCIGSFFRQINTRGRHPVGCPKRLQHVKTTGLGPFTLVR